MSDPYKIHLNWSDHETSDSGNSDFDEEYFKFQPPPIAILPQNVITIEATKNSRKSSGNVKILKIANTSYDVHHNATYSVAVKKKGGKKDVSDLRKKKTTVLINKEITGKHGLTTKKKAIKNAIMIEASKSLQKKSKNVKIAQTRNGVHQNSTSTVTVKNKGEKKDASDVRKRKTTVLINKKITGKHGLTTKKNAVKNVMIESSKNLRKDGRNVKIPQARYDIHQNVTSTVTVKNKGEKKDASGLTKKKITALRKKEITGNHDLTSSNKSIKINSVKNAIAKTYIMTKNQFVPTIAKYSDIAKKGAEKFKAEADLFQKRKNRNTNSGMISPIHDEADHKILQNYSHFSINEPDNFFGHNLYKDETDYQRNFPIGTSMSILISKKKKQKKNKEQTNPQKPIKRDKKVKVKNKTSIITSSEKQNDTTYSYYKYSNSNFEIYNGPLIGEISDNREYEQQKTQKPEPIHNLFYPEFKKNDNSSNRQELLNNPENSNELLTVSKLLDNLLKEKPGHSSFFDNGTNKTNWPVVEWNDSHIDSYSACFEGSLMKDEEYRIIQNTAESWRLGFGESIPNDHWTNQEYPGKSNDLLKPLENNYSRTISTEKTTRKSEKNKQEKKELISNEHKDTITSYFEFPNEENAIIQKTEFLISQNKSMLETITNIERNMDTMQQKTQKDYQRVSSFITPIIYEPEQNDNLTFAESIQNNYWSNHKIPRIDEELFTETSLTNPLSEEPGHISVLDDTNCFKSTTKEASTKKSKKKKQKKNKKQMIFNEENCPLVELGDPHFEFLDGSQIKYDLFDGSLMKDEEYRFIQNKAESWRLGFAESIPNDHWTNQEQLDYPGKINDLFTISKPLEKINYSRMISAEKTTNNSERNKQKKKHFISNDDEDTRTSMIQCNSYFGFLNEEDEKPQENYQRVSSPTIHEPEPNGNPCFAESIRNNYWSSHKLHFITETSLTNHLSEEPGHISNLDDTNYPRSTIIETTTKKSKKKKQKKNIKQIIINEDICPLVELNDPHIRSEDTNRTSMTQCDPHFEISDGSQIKYEEEKCIQHDCHSSTDSCVTPNNNTKNPSMLELRESTNYNYGVDMAQTTQENSQQNMERKRNDLVNHQKEIDSNVGHAELIQSYLSKHKLHEYLSNSCEVVTETYSFNSHLLETQNQSHVDDDINCFTTTPTLTSMTETRKMKRQRHRQNRKNKSRDQEVILPNMEENDTNRSSITSERTLPYYTDNFELLMNGLTIKDEQEDVAVMQRHPECECEQSENLQMNQQLSVGSLGDGSETANNKPQKKKKQIKNRKNKSRDQTVILANMEENDTNRSSMASSMDQYVVTSEGTLPNYTDICEPLMNGLTSRLTIEDEQQEVAVMPEFGYEQSENPQMIQQLTSVGSIADGSETANKKTLKKKKQIKNRKNKSSDQTVTLPNMEENNTNRSSMASSMDQYVVTSEGTLPNYIDISEPLMDELTSRLTIKDEQQGVAVMPDFEYEQSENLRMNQQLTSVDQTVTLPNMEENNTNRSSIASSMDQYVVISEVTLPNYTDMCEPLMNELTSRLAIKDEQQEVAVMPEFEYEQSENLRMNQQLTSVGSIADGSETANNKSKNKHTHCAPKRRSILRRCLNSVSKMQITIMGGCFVWLIYLFKKK